jgi:hypothetical protein
MIRVFALFLTGLLVVSAARAEAPEASLKAFLAKFADMAARGAADAAAKVTRFPLKNDVYQQPRTVSAAGFKHHFKSNSYPELADCLKTTPPRRAPGPKAEPDEWEVDCDGNIFHFARVGGAWRHSGFENVNE